MTNGVFANWEWWCDPCGCSSTEGGSIHSRVEAQESWRAHKAMPSHQANVKIQRIKARRGSLDANQQETDDRGATSRIEAGGKA